MSTPDPAAYVDTARYIPSTARTARTTPPFWPGCGPGLVAAPERCRQLYGRVLCDARILNIFEGAAEIQAQVIARRVPEGN